MRRWFARKPMTHRVKFVVVACAVALFVAAFIPGQPAQYLTEDAEAQWLPPGQLRAHNAKARPNDYFPQHRDAKAIKAVDELVGVDGKLSNVELSLNLPQPSAEGMVALDDIAKIQPLIKGRTGALEVQLQPSSSGLQTRLVNGRMFMYGSLSGTISYKNGATAEATIGVAAIPSLDQAHFSVMLSVPQDAQTNVTPLHVTFGNLEPTAELLGAMAPKQ